MRTRLVEVLCLLGILLAAASLAGPWWTVHFSWASPSFSYSGTTDLGLFRPVTSIESLTENVSQTQVYLSLSSNYLGSPNKVGVLVGAAALTIASVVSGAITVGFTAMSDRRPRLARWARYPAILSAVMALTAAVYVMILLPGAASQDVPGGQAVFPGFWGSVSPTVVDSQGTLTTAAGWAWYAVIAAAVLFLAVALLAFRRPQGPGTVSPQTKP